MEQLKERIAELETELASVKEQLKKYTAPARSKTYILVLRRVFTPPSFLLIDFDTFFSLLLYFESGSFISRHDISTIFIIS